MTTKADALAVVDREWSALATRFASLDAAQFARPVFGEGDGWTLGDMPAHFAFWWRMAARGARHAAATRAAPDQSTSVRTFLGIGEHFDTLNAESFSRWRARPVAERVSEMRAAHDDLVAALRDLPDEFLLCDDPSTDGMRRYLWQPAVNHPRQHRPHIESALKEGARA